ncbi:MAG: signal peptide peptidase SppA [Chloroflexales bacterium]|nr:signal peptide peptidase SppA [Chloroflexales bacterium]
MPILWIINGWRWLRNSWRRLLRRRVDYVRLDLTGALPEFAPEPAWWQRRFLGARSTPSLMRLRRQLEHIAIDPHAQGVLLTANAFAPGWATAQSLRDALQIFRSSGKQVVAYLITPDTRSYYALCGADHLWMPPTALLNLLGLRVEAVFLKDALALAGIEAEVTAVSPYKSAGDQFARADMSPENREQLERLLDGRFAQLVAAISADRDLAHAQVQVLIDNAPYLGPAARATGLVDDVCYEDEFEAKLADFRSSAADSPASKIILQGWDAAQRALRLPYRAFQRRYVAVVSVEGAISSGASRNLPLPVPLIGGQSAGSDSIIQALRSAERNPRVAAVVLHVDSPGGDAFASDMIWRDVQRVQRRKPVVVSMGNVAASGGYYISAPANAIFAQPGTITGSIGVISLRPVASELLERARIRTVVLSRGARTGLLSATLPPTDDERTALRATIFGLYEDFKRVVRAGRNLPEERLEPIAGGRVWTGADALALGLVDMLGGLPQAIVKAYALAGIEAALNTPVIRLRVGGRGPATPPLPFPANLLGSEFEQLAAEALRTRILAALPFVLREY